MPRTRFRLAAALLLALALAALGGVRHNGFIFLDDAAHVTENPVVREGLTARGALWALTTTSTSNWHPLTWLSHLADVSLFGLRPAGHHLVSLALHAGNALLLFAALAALTGALWRSFLVAALFAVHPLHVESVAWASERKDVLSTFLALLCVLAWVRARRRPGSVPRGAVAGLFALSLAAKPMPVTLPFLLLLLDWWPLGRWSPSPGAPPGADPPAAGFLPPARLWREKLPLFVLAGAAALVTFAVQSGTGATAWGRTIPLAVRAANALHSAVRYLGKTLWPRGLTLFYPYPPGPPAWWLWAGSLAALAAATWIAFRLARRRPYLAVGWLWYLGTLVPVIGLVQVGGQAWADRYVYLPLTGVFLAAVWLAADLASSRPPLRRALAAAAACALVALAALSHAQVRLWRDNVTLFTNAIAVTGRNAVAESALGIVAARQGRYPDAVARFRAALEIDPEDASALYNLGLALSLEGRRDEAAAAWERAVALDPGLDNARDALRRLREPSTSGGAPGGRP